MGNDTSRGRTTQMTHQSNGRTDKFGGYSARKPINKLKPIPPAANAKPSSAPRSSTQNGSATS
jgi:hypothetical protein